MLAVLLMSVACATTRYTSKRTIADMDEVSYVLANYYPQLHSYYMEGVLNVKSLKEVILEDGTADYKIKYNFVRYYYRDFRERIEVVKSNYPELYEMYISGVIDINSVYKYVEEETGKIKIHVSYSRIYDYYYRYYPNIRGGAVHIYQYRPRRYPMAPRRMQPTTPPPRPQPNRPRPEVRPGERTNNPPRQPGGNAGGNRPPQGNNGGRR